MSLIGGVDRFRQGLHQARFKVQRANQNAQEICFRFKQYADSDSFRVALETDPITGGQRFQSTASNFPVEIYLALGECVRNLDCAFDYVASGLLEALTGESGRQYFPMAKNRVDLAATFQGKAPGQKQGTNYAIAQSSPVFAELLMTDLEPFKSGKYGLWETRQLAKQDKHNLILPTARLSQVEGVNMSNSSGTRVTNMTVTVQGDGSFTMIENWSDPLVVTDFGRGHVELYFSSDSAAFAGAPVRPILHQCIHNTRAMIDLCDQVLMPIF